MEEKLRTLKDFELMDDHLEIDHYTLKELKQEAIKWIKSIDRDLYSESEADFLDKIKITGLTATREWIMNFFNLEENEIKCQKS